ncbi:putative E3 ubiquitin-protein ligase MARCHF10 [Manis javanica]|nr:putative E3 ubiquitin-protein ligase MARCHF10 [Manis javanica]
MMLLNIHSIVKYSNGDFMGDFVDNFNVLYLVDDCEVRGRGLRIMLHQAKDRQKFISDVQYLRDMQHKVDSEYQACLRRQDYRRDPNEKKRDQFGGQETNFERSQFSSGSSFKQSSGEEDPLTETRLSAENPAVKCDSRLPAIDQSSVKQKHKSTITPQKPEKAGPGNPSPGDSSEYPLFCVEYSPFCSVFAQSPVLQPNSSHCCLLLPLVPLAPKAAQDPTSRLLPSFMSYSPSSSGPRPKAPATLWTFPISCPSLAEIPVLCLPSPRRPSKIYLMWYEGHVKILLGFQLGIKVNPCDHNFWANLEYARSLA